MLRGESTFPPSQTRILLETSRANRGIGFEIVRQLLESSSNIVVATCRDLEKATALYDIGKASQGTLYVLKLDIGDFDSVRASASTLEKVLGGTGLDYLINNAGIVSILRVRLLRERGTLLTHSCHTGIR